MASHFIAHDGTTIWGAGDTPEQALVEVQEYGGELVGIVTSPCTDRLYNRIPFEGAFIRFQLVAGVAELLED